MFGWDSCVSLSKSAVLKELKNQNAHGARNFMNFASSLVSNDKATDGEILEAESTEPCELQVKVPLDYKAGDPVCFQGPHGPLAITPTEDREPGDIITVRLAPPATYEVKVPPNAKPGERVSFSPDDGGPDIEAVVPEHKKPGDTFQVTPSAVMVQVPENAKEGTTLRFKIKGVAKQVANADTATAVVPKGLSAGAYFAVTF
eukprot:gnl/MRDRNA2_/MRDRNA2_99379_c0_seq1.p1 gnl/MRDRNA2_/MRDRNA2_99379_c0~~gnl/MRDRNA2_/MRDRNA2_99379_c0_seq1.p1  ORF type:complete len:202 (+),score=41.26 gnl/MRDRNA2_/MRDRNA2_99379_c0_seq1:83-688(+)